MPSFRTFVAIDVSPEIRTAATKLIRRLEQTSAKVRWVEPENLHLTLKFLGEVDQLKILEVCREVTAAVAELPPFLIEARGAGAFPSLERPRTVWIGIGQGRQELEILHEVLDERLDQLGIRAEGRQFKPHLTIGRVRGGGPGIAELGRLLQAEANFAGGMVDVPEVVVYSSLLLKGGARHEALAVAPLAGQ